MTAATCPWCQAPRAEGPSCPTCGANYAKAEAIKKGGKAAAAAEPPPAVEPQPAAKDLRPFTEDFDPDKAIDSQMEWKWCLGAIPAALLIALLMHFAVPGLQRIVFAMPLHEMGHAVAGWLCGFSSIPMPWMTHTPEARGFIAPILLWGAMGYLAFRAWRAQKWVYVVLCAAVLVLALYGTFTLKVRDAKALITFAGDGLGMIFGIALMASFFFGKGTQLYRGSLRWGFLFIGATAFIDLYAVWWGARKDFGLIPFGEQERAGASDATRMVDWYNWTADQLVHRYFVLGLVCLAVLAAIWAWGTWRAWNFAQKK